MSLYDPNFYEEHVGRVIEENEQAWVKKCIDKNMIPVPNEQQKSQLEALGIAIGALCKTEDKTLLCDTPQRLVHHASNKLQKVKSRIQQEQNCGNNVYQIGWIRSTCQFGNEIKIKILILCSILFLLRFFLHWFFAFAFFTQYGMTIDGRRQCH